jgi:hypothetical protein
MSHQLNNSCSTTSKRQRLLQQSARPARCVHSPSSVPNLGDVVPPSPAVAAPALAPGASNSAAVLLGADGAPAAPLLSSAGMFAAANLGPRFQTNAGGALLFDLTASDGGDDDDDDDDGGGAGVAPSVLSRQSRSSDSKWHWSDFTNLRRHQHPESKAQAAVAVQIDDCEDDSEHGNIFSEVSTAPE